MMAPQQTCLTLLVANPAGEFGRLREEERPVVRVIVPPDPGGRARAGFLARHTGQGRPADPRHGVIAIATGVFPVLMAWPALLVAVLIGVTVPAFQFVT
jgi:hypothetical protein